MKKNHTKTLVLIFGLGVSAITLLILLLNSFAPSQVMVNGILTERVPTTYPAYDVARVGVAEAKRAFEENGAILIDVRSQEEYQLNHIAHAINLPLVNEEAFDLDLSPDAILITYCT